LAKALLGDWAIKSSFIFTPRLNSVSTLPGDTNSGKCIFSIKHRRGLCCFARKCAKHSNHHQVTFKLDYIYKTIMCIKQDQNHREMGQHWAISYVQNQHFRSLVVSVGNSACQQCKSLTSMEWKPIDGIIAICYCLKNVSSYQNIAPEMILFFKENSTAWCMQPSPTDVIKNSISLFLSYS